MAVPSTWLVLSNFVSVALHFTKRTKKSLADRLLPKGEATLDPAYEGKAKPDLFTEDVPLAIQTLTEGSGEVGRLFASFDIQREHYDTGKPGFFLQEISGITTVLKDNIYNAYHDTNWTLKKLLGEKKSV